MHRWRLGVIAVFAMIILVSPLTVLAASQTAATATAVKSATATKPPSAAAAVQPQRGGIYKVLFRTNSNVFGYPARIVGAARDFAPPFFDHLLSIGDDGKYKPGLALSWDTAKDGKTMTFKLRKGVVFHDGSPFNAQAVKFNIDNLIPPKATILTGITSVEVPDDYTVKLNLSGFDNLILYRFANDVATYMYSPEAVKKNGEDWATTHPVGTGPFMLKEYVPNVSLTLLKNPHYWQKGLPYLDGIVMSIVTDPMTQVLTFKAGQANAIYSAQQSIPQLRDEGYPLQMGYGSLQALNFDIKNSEIFSKRQAREAIEYAIDKQAICNGPGEGIYKPVYQIVSSSSPDYNKSCPPRKYDVGKAKKLLAEAGYPNGFSFKAFVTETAWKDGWVAVQSYLDKIGIKMEINYLNAAAFNLIRAGKVEKGAASYQAINISSYALFTLDSYWRTDSPTYPYVIKPAEVDKVIDQAKLSRDMATIRQLNQKAIKLIYDAEPVVPLWEYPRIAVLDKSVQNTGWFIYSDPDNNEFGTKTWLKK